MRFTRHGYIRVLFDGEEVSRHTAIEEACESASRHFESQPGGRVVYLIDYPQRSVVFERAVDFSHVVAPAAARLSLMGNAVIGGLTIRVGTSEAYTYAAGNPIPNGLLVDFGQEITNTDALYRIVSYNPTDSAGRWSNIGDNGAHSFDATGTTAGQTYTITYEIDEYEVGAAPTTGTYSYTIT